MTRVGLMVIDDLRAMLTKSSLKTYLLLRKNLKVICNGIITIVK